MLETVASIPIKRPKPNARKPQGMCMDKGYDYNECHELVAEFGFTGHIRSRGEEAQAIKKRAGYKARRWVVERTHSWMNRFRRILIRWEKTRRHLYCDAPSRMRSHHLAHRRLLLSLPNYAL